MAERDPCAALESLAVLLKQQCRRSMAGKCSGSEEKPIRCFRESAEPEVEENCQLGNIDKRRRKFVKNKKDELQKLGNETFEELIKCTKPKKPEKEAESDVKGAIYQFEEFKTPFTESNSTVSGISNNADAEEAGCSGGC